MTLTAWVSDNAFSIVAVLLLVGCVLSVAGFFVYDRRASIKKYREHRRELRVQRGVAMGKKDKAARQSHVKGLLADAITNGLEEAWFAGKITAEERDACYRMIGKTHGIPDLLPHMSPAQLKSLIKGRRSAGSVSPAQEVPAWGEKPAAPKKVDDTTNVIHAKKRFGEKALRLKSA